MSTRLTIAEKGHLILVPWWYAHRGARSAGVSAIRDSDGAADAAADGAVNGGVNGEAYGATADRPTSGENSSFTLRVWSDAPVELLPIPALHERVVEGRWISGSKGTK